MDLFGFLKKPVKEVVKGPMSVAPKANPLSNIIDPSQTGPFSSSQTKQFISQPISTVLSPKRVTPSPIQKTAPYKDDSKTGIFLNTIKGLPQAAGEVFNDVTRGLLSFGVSVAEAPIRLNPKYTNIKTDPLKVPIFGDVESIQTRLVKNLETGMSNKKAVASALFDTVINEPTGVIFKPVIIAGSLIGKLGKTDAQLIAKSVNEMEIKKILQKTFKDSIQEPVLDAFSKILKYMDNADDVQSVFNRIDFKFKGHKGFQADETPAPQSSLDFVKRPIAEVLPDSPSLPSNAQIIEQTALKTVGGVGEGDVSSIPPELQPLAEEARKSKNLDEFSQNIRQKFVDEQRMEPSSMKTVEEWFKAKQTQPFVGIGGANPEGLANKPFISDLPKNAPELKRYEFTPDGKVIMYRGIPEDVTTRGIRYGDFLSADKNKASFYGKVERYELDPKDVKVLGDLEAVYVNEAKKLSAPQPLSLTDFYNKATQEAKPIEIKTKAEVPTKVQEVIRKIKVARQQRSLIPKEGFSPDKIEELATKIRTKDLTKKEVEDLQTELSIREEALENSSVKQLRKYVSKSTGSLPEVTGKPTMKSTSGSGKEIKNSEFGMRGDDIVTELGYSSVDDAQEALDSYAKYREMMDQLKDRLSRLREEKRQIKMGEFLMKIAMSERRAVFKAIKNQFQLTDSEMKDIRKGVDLSAMNDQEYKQFIQDSKKKAEELSRIRKARIQLEYTMEAKQLKKVENLRKALKLPEIKNMNEQELIEFEKLLDGYEWGDEFLGQRKLETIDRTDLAGVKTYREAKQKLAEKLSARFDKKITVNDLNNITNSGDTKRWDTLLAEKNPFYRLMVEDFGASMMDAEGKYIKLQEEINKLMRQAHRGKSLFDKAVPRDNAIIEYLESSNKPEMAKRLTPAEYKAADYIHKYFNDALDYLYQVKALNKSRFENTYYPHTKRGALEAIADTAGSFKKKLSAAVKSIVEKEKLEKVVIDILDQKTGQILPMDKYFKYVNKRTGEGPVSRNVTKVFLEYAKMLETKKALDAVIPEIMSYVDILTPRKETRAGLKTDDKLKNFVTEYINNKKGRKKELFFTQGSKGDLTLKALNNFVSLRDLGVNLAVQIGSNAGAQGGVYTILGPGNYLKGLYRYRATIIPKKVASQEVKNLKNILSEAKPYTGINPWTELADISKDLGNKVNSAMFVLFRDAIVRANQIHLLGSLTKKELSSGKISKEKLQQLKVEAGRWLPTEKGESIYGATTVGKSATKYKTWAIVIAHRAFKNFIKMGQMIGKGNIKELYNSREFRETLNAGVYSALVFFVGMMAADSIDEEKPTFLGKVKKRLINDGMSFLAAINPVLLLSEPRVFSFVKNLMTSMWEIIKLEKYNKGGKDYDKGDLKGVNHLINTLFPTWLQDTSQYSFDKTMEFFDSKNASKIQLSNDKLKSIKLPKKKAETKIKLPKQNKKLPKLKLPKKKQITLPKER